jgi:hypothetical protein
MHRSRTARFLISDRIRSQNLRVAELPGPQAEYVTLTIEGDAQGQVDGPVGDLALRNLHADRIDEDHRIHL